MKMFHSRCRWVCFFIWEIQHYITCSVTDALQWMGAVGTRVQTADKHIRLIHTSTSVNILWSEVKSCVCKKSLRHFNFKPSLLAKYKSIIHNNASSSDKVYSLYIKTHWHICLTVFRAWSVHISLLIQHNFSLKKAILWIEERWSEIEICFLQTCSFSLHNI